ncbi:MAG: insulinase family protein [Polyangiaceae bacterium]|jgi:predicted Zn-dependent peptidase|nr:insulinase family protein [Polyangiaceae bacterium]
MGWSRWKKGLTGLVLGGFLGLLPGGDEARAAPPEVQLAHEKYTLENGLEVILHEDHRSPVAAVNLWYHVGSKDEGRGKSGFAHLFEHMMFEGSRHVGEGMFLRYLDSIGATERNGTTNTDRTSYFETVSRGRLELALWLESDRMAFLLDRLNQASLDRQREVVKNELRERYENVPYGLVPRFLRAALFHEEHPYHHLAIGSAEDLDRASLDDVRAFFRTFYVPNNATLVIAGDIDPSQVKSQVQRYFGTIPRGAVPPIKRGPMPVTLPGETRLEIEADVELPRVYVSWPTPPLFAPGDAELDALGKVLSVGRSSRLQRRLVHELKIAQHVGAQQASSELASVFEVVLTLRPGVAPRDALALLDQELEALRKEGPSLDEVRRARARQTTHVIFATERVSSRANGLNLYNQFARDPAFLPRDLARFEALSPASLQRALAEHLPPRQRVVAVVTPTPSAPRAGRLLKTP